MIFTTDKPVFAIGDCHGHLNRLEALLTKEGIIGPCPDCNGLGDDPDSGFCDKCAGSGTRRLRDDCFVVQLGDLGHFGSSWVGPPRGGHSVPGSQMADMMTYEHGSRWLDIVLWGNHDRAVIDRQHAFGGYISPPVETFRMMQKLRDEGRMILSFAAHGFLLTHAGLHKQFKYNDVPTQTKTDPVAFAKWCNENCDLDTSAIVDAISSSRGGWSPYGGILWRDANESLFPGFRQVFGHTSKPKIRRYENEAGWSFCIDVGDKDNGRLAGIWLPNEDIVEVDVSKDPGH
jgi:hypothetical protein